MKVFSIKNTSELVELQVSKEDNLYTCDSSPTNFKFLTGGKKGSLFYLQSKENWFLIHLYCISLIYIVFDSYLHRLLYSYDPQKKTSKTSKTWGYQKLI